MKGPGSDKICGMLKLLATPRIFHKWWRLGRSGKKIVFNPGVCIFYKNEFQLNGLSDASEKNVHSHNTFHKNHIVSHFVYLGLPFYSVPM